MPTKPDDSVRPHPVLTDYYPDEGARRARVDQMFDASARHYDKINAIMSFGSGRWYRRTALLRAGLSAGDRVLDVGAGTGVLSLLAQEIVGGGGHVVALDPSQGMLDVARANGVRNVKKGLGEALPFSDNEYDFVIMGYALRHVSDLRVLFGEYRRVLRPGGRVLLLEITPPESRLGKLLLKAYLKGYVPTLTRLLVGSAEAQQLMKYYWDTIENCVPPPTILGVMKDVGLAGPARHVVMNVFSEYSATKAK